LALPYLSSLTSRDFFIFQCSGHPRDLHSFPTRRSSDLGLEVVHREHGGHREAVEDRLADDAHDDAAQVARRQLRRDVGNDLLHLDRKSTRLNSSHVAISYAVFCLKKKKKKCLDM